MKTGKIKITNQSPTTTTVDIEGVIGVPEQWQFEEPGERVATYDKFREVLESIKELETEEVVVNIRSTGGNVNDALLIYDALRGLSAEVVTRCYGYVASAATIIAQAATKGKREISANSLYLIHKSVSTAEGNAEEIARSLELLNKSDQRIAQLYADRSGRSIESFEQLMEQNAGNGRWLAPEEVVEAGLADRVVSTSPIEASAAQMVESLGLPPIPKKGKFNGSGISQRWSALLEVLGIITPSEESQPQNQQSDTVMADSAVVENSEQQQDTAEEVRHREQNSLAELTQALEQKMEIENIQKREIEHLQNRVTQLEAQNARMGAGATQTLHKEDPAPQETIKSANELAYLEDLRGLSV